jgi:hypothetical protein
LLPDTLKLTAATVAVLVIGAISTRIPLPFVSNIRFLAALALGKVSLACMLAAWPALILTKSLNGTEGKAFMSVFLPRRIRAAHPSPETLS